MENSAVLVNYKFYKNNFTNEAYLDIVPYNLRFFLTRLRLGLLPLRIQTGRYARNRIPRNERICLCCSNAGLLNPDIEDEFHFLLKCPCFDELRHKYIPQYYYKTASMYKFLQLLQHERSKVLTHLAIFVRDALLIRTQNMNIVTVN